MSDYAIPIVITRCVIHDHQPPIVECILVDAQDRVWRFEEKCAVPSARPLDGNSPYPQPGLFACEIISSRVDESGSGLSIIETSPWSVTALDDDHTDRFEVAVPEDTAVSPDWDLTPIRGCHTGSELLPTGTIGKLMYFDVRTIGSKGPTPGSDTIVGIVL